MTRPAYNPALIIAAPPAVEVCSMTVIGAIAAAAQAAWAATTVPAGMSGGRASIISITWCTTLCMTPSALIPGCNCNFAVSDTE